MDIDFYSPVHCYYVTVEIDVERNRWGSQCHKLCLYFPALPIYRSYIYHNSTQHTSTAPQVNMNTVSQCSSWCRGGNSSTATHCNTDAVEYEQRFLQRVLQALLQQARCRNTKLQSCACRHVFQEKRVALSVKANWPISDQLVYSDDGKRVCFS